MAIDRQFLTISGELGLNQPPFVPPLSPPLASWFNFGFYSPFSSFSPSTVSLMVPGLVTRTADREVSGSTPAGHSGLPLLFLLPNPFLSLPFLSLPALSLRIMSPLRFLARIDAWHFSLRLLALFASGWA